MKVDQRLAGMLLCSNSFREALIDWLESEIQLATTPMEADITLINRLKAAVIIGEKYNGSNYEDPGEPPECA